MNKLNTVSDIKNSIKQRKDDALTLEERLKLVDYSTMALDPSPFAVSFITFIKLCNDGKEENHNAPFHLDMIDTCLNSRYNRRSLNVCFRGSSKTSIFLEYLIFYLAIHKELPYVKNIDAMLAICDSVDNGVKSLVSNIRSRYKKSIFLQKYITSANITKEEFRFTNVDGEEFTVVPSGIKQGIRGVKRDGKRPKVAVFDDLFKDDDATSDVIMDSISKIMEAGVKNALHPKEHLIIWNNTVFNEEDLVYRTVKSGGWNVNVYPVCNKFPCDRSEFVGAWEDRFDYDAVATSYIEAELSDLGTEPFFQEMMLDVTTRRIKVISIDEIKYFDQNIILNNKELYNFYITSDIGVTDTKDSDYTVIGVWAYTSNGTFLLVDLFMDTCLIDVFYEQLFRLVKKYRVDQVVVEISGQQKAISTQISTYMATYNIYFDLIEARPTIGQSKHKRFMSVSNKFPKKIQFYKQIKDLEVFDEIKNELNKVTKMGFNSKHDDFLDMISQIGLLNPYSESPDIEEYQEHEYDIFGSPIEIKDQSVINRYIV